MLYRCEWVCTDPLMIDYHDTKWGLPILESSKLFELLCLEGAQAGLSWRSVLQRRDGYRLAFDSFDAEKMAVYDAEKVMALLKDSRIIRNKLKIRAFITNA